MKEPIIEIAKAVVAGGKARITKKRGFLSGVMQIGGASATPRNAGRPSRFSKFVDR